LTLLAAAHQRALVADYNLLATHPVHIPSIILCTACLWAGKAEIWIHPDSLGITNAKKA